MSTRPTQTTQRRQTTSGGVVATYDNVKRLEQIELPDRCPSIEVHNPAISYDLTTAQNSDFEDRGAYATNAASRFVEETKDLGDMVGVRCACNPTVTPNH